MVTHGIELMKILSEKGHEVHLFYVSREEFGNPKKIQLHRIPCRNSLPIIPSALDIEKLNKKLKELDLDIVHLQLPFFFFDRHISKIKFPCPVVGTLHQSFSGQSVYDLPLQVYYKIFTEKTLNVCDRIICVSKAVRDTIKTNKPIDVIYNGVDTKTFKPGKKKGEFILYVGRILFEKGFHHLLMAHNILKRESDIKLNIIGSGPLSFAAGITGAKYLGVVPKHVLVENYQAAQIGVFPSIWNEAGSRVLLECMACGTPGVSYRVGAFPEIIDEGVDGFMCSKNPRELADTIKKALDADLVKMGMKARQKVLKKFSLEVVYQQTLKAYKKMLGKVT